MVDASRTIPVRSLTALLAVVAFITGLLIAPRVSDAQVGRTPPPEVVVLARSDQPADALSAGPVAGVLGAPVLLTAQAQLLDVAAQALVAADPDLVILAGGEAALSPQVEADVAALGYATRRVAGADRHETAARIAALLTEFGTGRPLLSDIPITDEVIPGLNAERLGGLTLAEILAQAGDGAQGPPGPQGPAGPQGPVGPQGPPGLVGHELHRSYQSATSSVSNNTIITAVNVAVTTTDECGDGSTRHRFIAYYTATARMIGGGPGDVTFAGAQILAPAETLNLGADNGIPKAADNFVKRPSGTFVGPLNITRAIQGIEPGATTIRVDFQNQGPHAIDLLHNELVVHHFGWTCGAARNAAPTGPPPAIDGPHENTG